MNEWWQPTFDPWDVLIDLNRRVSILEQNQQALVKAQNDLGESMRQLVEQHNTIIALISKDRQKH
jgi:hypothetical protein